MDKEVIRASHTPGKYATKMAVSQARRHRADFETIEANLVPQLTRTTYLKRLDPGASNFAIPEQQLSSRTPGTCRLRFRGCREKNTHIPYPERKNISMKPRTSI